MPPFAGAAEWLNSEPLGPAELRGHVVLVNFWTLTCINWLRQEPYVRAWSQAYRDDGLIVIGVHTPEFSFEHEIDRVRQAIKRASDRLPGRGRQRLRDLERVRQPLLAGAVLHRQGGHHPRRALRRRTLRAIRAPDPAAARRRARARPRRRASASRRRPTGTTCSTPETYLGYGRSERFSSADGAAFDEPRAYELPERLRVNHWSLDGEWTIGRENVVLDQPGGSIAYRFHARDAHLVLSSGAREPIPFRVLLDGEAPGPSHGVDVDEDGNGCSGTVACTSSCASTTRSASGTSRSPSSSPAQRRTRSPSGKGLASRQARLAGARSRQPDRLRPARVSRRADDSLASRGSKSASQKPIDHRTLPSASRDRRARAIRSSHRPTLYEQRLVSCRLLGLARSRDSPGPAVTRFAVKTGIRRPSTFCLKGAVGGFGLGPASCPPALLGGRRRDAPPRLSPIGRQHRTLGMGSAVTHRALSWPRAAAGPFRSATPGLGWPAEASGRGLRAAPRPRRRDRGRRRRGGESGTGPMRGSARRAVTRRPGTRRWSATGPR